MSVNNIESKPGFLLIDKPSGPTSHHVINRLRRLTGIKRIGHAGTLDPFASGLLLVAVGREATRELDRFIKQDKEYTATLRLGAETDTFDREGRILSRSELPAPPIERIGEALRRFEGRQKQVPPMFSAKKFKGKKLYELARQGIEIERQPVEIEISELAIVDYHYPHLRIRVKCSSGTYIRALAADIGRELGSGAYLEELERTKLGRFSLDGAVSLEALEAGGWQSYLFWPSMDK